ncbi:uncharacterized protein LOC109545614 isoform X3 [Dendroctonus ponderosae]|uniref:uncharacterized protein LOC109545614 isoform X3 n=1 Tax=Dendroctonus ponderosae TaxID=77166 RepID=UPI0020355AF9|nr:uncharacterized protein LOC109545614 isoform X3 [Dendroctonus ponderosae]
MPNKRLIPVNHSHFKGTINPDEDTLIEIPRGLHEQPIVIARTGLQEKSISIQRSIRNVDVEGNKYREAEDRSKIKIVQDGNDESFQPKFHSSARSHSNLENSRNFDENVTLSSRYDEMQKAKKELEESGFFNATNPPPSSSFSPNSTNNVSNSSCCFVDFKELFTKSQHSTSSTPCDKSVQFKSSTLPVDLVARKFTSKSDTSSNNSSLSLFKEDNSASRSSSRKNVFNNTPSFRSGGSLTSSRKDLASCRFPSASSSETFEDMERKAIIPASTQSSKDPICVNKVCSTESHSGRKKSSKCGTCSSRTQSIMNESILSQSKSRRTDKKSHSGLEEDECRSAGNLLEDKDRLNKFYKRRSNEIDEIYIDQLKRQFEEAKRKLEDALMLASMSLKQLGDNKRRLSKASSRYAPICDSVPELDISFVPFSGKSPSCALDAPVSSHSNRTSVILGQDRASESRFSAAQRLPTSKTRAVNSKITQTSLDYWPIEQDHFKPGGSKCLACCEPQRSSSMKSVKVARCNISDSESFLDNHSALLS